MLWCFLVYVYTQDDTLCMKENHPYFYQIQGQMAVTGKNNCILVAFTNRGVFSVKKVNFNPEFWHQIERKMTKFYKENYAYR